MSKKPKIFKGMDGLYHYTYLLERTTGGRGPTMFLGFATDKRRPDRIVADGWGKPLAWMRRGGARFSQRVVECYATHAEAEATWRMMAQLNDVYENMDFYNVTDAIFEPPKVSNSEEEESSKIRGLDSAPPLRH